ncbi:flagellar hook-basal body complex protein [Arcobacter sp.]|uniref:flagellar hook-basal body complex protein n=1 Tax=Arcobacter sp. TaxID=1872629 RepID=UPI003C748D9E
MNSSLYNGLSGIYAASNYVDVTSNNIANVNTIAHKEDRISFADQMYQNGIGKGVGTGTVNKTFRQGDVQDTNNQYDFAIQGKGFFILTDPKTDLAYYTRAGNFTKSNDGTLVNSQGLNVMGLQTKVISTTSSDGTTIFGDNYTQHLASSIITQEDRTISINAKATDYTKSATDVGVSGNNYKSSDSVISDIELLKTDYTNKLKLLESNPNEVSVPSTLQKTNIIYKDYKTDLKNADDALEINIGNLSIKQNYDTDPLTTMKKFADKISDIQGYTASFDEATNTLTIDNLVAGRNSKVTMPIITSSTGVISDIPAVKGTGLAMVESSRDALNSAVQLANAQFLDVQNGIPAPNQSTLELESINLQPTKIGLASYNDDTSFSVTSDGILLLTQGSNTYIAGRVSTAYFPDEQSLNPEGDNLYTQTKESGVAKNADTLNTVVSHSVEVSNINTAKALTKLIIAQRAFEANSKAITTSDSFLDTAIKLKTT